MWEEGGDGGGAAEGAEVTCGEEVAIWLEEDKSSSERAFLIGCCFCSRDCLGEKCADAKAEGEEAVALEGDKGLCSTLRVSTA